MNIYGQQPKVFSKAKNLFNNKLFNLASPNSAPSIFKALRERNLNRFGNYGNAFPPGQSPALFPIESHTPASTMDFREKLEQKNFETRDETIRRNSGISPLSIQAMPARTGIASAQPATGDIPAAIDDRGWQKTLGQLLGSGMSEEQLRTCSYSNIRSMIGGSGDDTWKNEMAYYLQRMIVEGYLHGVDIAREIKELWGGHVNINPVHWGVSGTLGMATWSPGGSNTGSGSRVELDMDDWKSMRDTSKMALFYHELGHALLDRWDHTGDIMNYGHFYSDWQKTNYNSYVDAFYRNGAGGTRKETPGTNLSAPQVDAWLKANPGAYPGISGVTGGDNFPTNPDGTPVTPTPVTINPPTVTPWSGALNPLTDSSSSKTRSADETEKTPVAGVLPDMGAVTGFAAGLQDTLRKSSDTLSNLGSALLKFKSG